MFVFEIKHGLYNIDPPHIYNMVMLQPMSSENLDLFEEALENNKRMVRRSFPLHRQGQTPLSTEQTPKGRKQSIEEKVAVARRRG
jgi:hypothetical protein